MRSFNEGQHREWIVAIPSLTGLWKGCPSTGHINRKRCVVMARATFRQRPPTPGSGRPLLTAAAARSLYNNPNGWGTMSPPRSPSPGGLGP
jgi:hypothetical protein